jgi:hypothetical protein
MILLNFAHPLTPAQLIEIEQLAGKQAERIIEATARFGSACSFVDQARGLVESTGLTAEEWQTLPLLINLPSHNVIAALVLAELHGRMGYFPAVLRLRPIPEITPPQFEVAEIINLQAVRERARQAR